MKNHAVILDEASFNPGDLDLSVFTSLVKSWDRYPTTSKEQRKERLKHTNIAIANKVIFDKPLYETLPKLEVILLTATGMDNVDLEFCQQQ